jgi:hypothetical protein
VKQLANRGRANPALQLVKPKVPQTEKSITRNKPLPIQNLATPEDTTSSDAQNRINGKSQRSKTRPAAKPVSKDTKNE